MIRLEFLIGPEPTLLKHFKCKIIVKKTAKSFIFKLIKANQIFLEPQKCINVLIVISEENIHLIFISLPFLNICLNTNIINIY